MFLSRKDIDERRNDLFPVPGQFDDSQLSQVSYDLRVGDEVFLSEKRIPIPLGPNSPFVVLPPGQFALIKTFEEIQIPPDLIGCFRLNPNSSSKV